MLSKSRVQILKDPSPRGVWLIGHRGAKGYAPENTMISFELASRMGVDMVECDVHLSKDQECMVFHDSELNRTSNGRGFLRECTAHELKKMDAGSWFSTVYAQEKIPLLSELLQWVKNKKSDLNLSLLPLIEIKGQTQWSVPCARRVVEELQNQSMVEQSIVIAKDWEALKITRQLDERIRTGWVQEKLVLNPVRLALDFGVSVLMPHFSIATKNYIRRAHDSGLTVAPWTVDHAKDAKKLISNKTDAISSNFPEMVNQLIAQNNIHG